MEIDGVIDLCIVDGGFGDCTVSLVEKLSILLSKKLELFTRQNSMHCTLLQKNENITYEPYP